VKETAGDIACQFREMCTTFVTFSIPTYLGTYVEDIAQLAVFYEALIRTSNS